MSGPAQASGGKMQFGQEHALDLLVIEREEIVALMTMPEHAPLGATFLGLRDAAKPDVQDLVARIRRSAALAVRGWLGARARSPVHRTCGGPYRPERRTPQRLGYARTHARRADARRTHCTRGTGRVRQDDDADTAGAADTVRRCASRRGSAQPGRPWEGTSWSMWRACLRSGARGLRRPIWRGSSRRSRCFLLLNGWNEVEESAAAFADVALRELDREFPGAGIVVATRTHHLVPPLPGALRLRLLPLRREQRAKFMAARLGGRATALAELIEADPTLDDLTRSPFVLSEVVSLFEAGAVIPGTKLGILARVLDLHERRNEHRNYLAAAPVFDRQEEFLQALACAMTRRAGVALTEADARAGSRRRRATTREPGPSRAVGGADGACDADRASRPSSGLIIPRRCSGSSISSSRNTTRRSTFARGCWGCRTLATRRRSVFLQNA